MLGMKRCYGFVKGLGCIPLVFTIVGIVFPETILDPMLILPSRMFEKSFYKPGVLEIFFLSSAGLADFRANTSSLISSPPFST